MNVGVRDSDQPWQQKVFLKRARVIIKSEAAKSHAVRREQEENRKDAHTHRQVHL